MSKELVYLLPKDKLPDGFRYPQKFQDMEGAIDPQTFYPWSFIPVNSEFGKLVYEVVALDDEGLFKDKPKLVPFARLELWENEIACFDGSDRSGKPAIIMATFDNSGRSYGFRDFEHWLQGALSDHQDWQKNSNRKR